MNDRPTTRLILLPLLLAASLCGPAFAIGPDDCSLYGSAGKKGVGLTYVDGDVYGEHQRSRSIYGWGAMGAKAEGSLFMRCSSSKNGPTTVYYETKPDGSGGYVCKSGCRSDVVKVFRMSCEGD